jgi:hypothetical protein
MIMKKLSMLSVITLIATGLSFVNAQQANEFKPYFKPLALVYSNVNTTFNNDGMNKAFEITRAYLGFEYFFTEKLSSRVNLDVADPGVGKLQMTAFVKNAYLLYKNNGFAVRFGMISTDQYGLQEKQWGYRYIYKSFQDAYNFGPSADLGVAMEYSPVKFMSFDLSVLNGEGYKLMQSDSALKETAGVTFRPFRGFTLRGYFDILNHQYNQTSFSLFAGYSTERFRSGLEYNMQWNNLKRDGRDLSGISVYSSYIIKEKFSVFARYDNLWSVILDGQTDPWNYNRDGQLFMVGFDYSPVKGVKIAPTYSGWEPDNSAIPFTSTIALNFEIRF